MNKDGLTENCLNNLIGWRKGLKNRPKYIRSLPWSVKKIMV